ncbi:GNAT family N-acetyltransferase [Mesorhizobium sp. ES1-4]|uniref:GNAT family N-acetyltransferase n=1 Tax=Mesorhizobium sp. ES1-4 TaxID=2876627 RepID=UPI001CCDEC02|nr:GNAT family N-acetyltransferase [Mesorhizobium sp. ES1-4]MBZ9796953.1 GNAT family N-acetyltransferase [Mesorhizobium sp. ES1-4]
MSENAHVLYAREPGLDVDDFRRVLVDSGLGEIRPVDDAARLRAMLSGADLVVTARLDIEGKPLIGVVRAMTDFSWVCYISDLAVSARAQGLGVGKGLMDEARQQLGPSVAISLVSVPDAVGFYERIGMKRMPDAFWFSRTR